MAALFRTRTRDEWVEFFAGHEVCFAPVLTMTEAREHPHNVARGTFTEVDGAPQPAPAPRFSRTPGAIERTPVVPGTDTDTALADWGFDAGDDRRAQGAGRDRVTDHSGIGSAKPFSIRRPAGSNVEGTVGTDRGRARRPR